MEPKSKWKSKTVWFNIISGLSTISLIFGIDLGLSEQEKLELVSGILVLINLGNLLLRKITKEPIK